MSYYSDGAFCFYRIPKDYVPMLPSDFMSHRYVGGGYVLPEYSGHRAIAGRAVSSIQTKVRKMGFLLESIKSSKEEMVYGIVSVEKDQYREKLDLQHEDSFRWTEASRCVSGSHLIAQMVQLKYQELENKILASDWAESITANIENACRGTAMREDGRVYWVPTSGIKECEKLQEFLASVRIQLIICQVESTQVPVVQQAVKETLADQLQKLTEESAAFDGKQKPSTYVNVIAEYRAIKGKILSYQASFDVAGETLNEALTKLEEKAQVFLDTRSKSTLHRDGTETQRKPRLLDGLRRK
jgi:hypothetical protein